MQKSACVICSDDVEERVLSVGKGSVVVAHLSQRISESIESRQHLVELTCTSSVPQTERAQCCNEKFGRGWRGRRYRFAKLAHDCETDALNKRLHIFNHAVSIAHKARIQ